MCLGHNVPLQGRQGSRGCIPNSPGESGLVSREAKDSALLSSRTGYFLDPTEWPKGSQSSCEVWREDQGLLSRSGRKEGPHLSLTGASCGFSRTVAPLWVFSRGTMGYSGSLLCGTREDSFPACGEGSASLLWRHGRGIGHQETLKKDSPSLSRVTSGNSGFPRLVPVTSGSFSGSL